MARSLTKAYGELTAVDHLDLTVQPGEIFGLLGPNGAGKTTTVLMFLGLTEPTSGVARVAGMDPARQPLEVKRRVGYLPDNVGFYGGMTGRQNLDYTARLNGIPSGEAGSRIDRLLDETGLRDAGDRKVETYSRGMRQRLGIADALVKDPAILILDEPTIAIDPVGVAEILALIRRLAEDHGLTVLLSSHFLGQVEQVCDRVGMFRSGRLIAQGSIEELAAVEGGTMRLAVGAEGDPDAVEAVLRGVDGVTRVERADRGEIGWQVMAERDVRIELGRALVAAGYPITRLQVQGTALDAIYRRYFEEPDGERRAGGPDDRVH